ncbi:MAG: ATP-binding cassette domain-containing protein [Pseudobutyrivibrio sp.]|nr:ATP-binding cassette domain-containing protein [Pseudobutyrivibrio sp.]
MLVIKGLSKRYADKVVYENIDLTFDKGISVLLAPNGAGKTTLMNMLVTIAKPDKGQILYNDKDIYKLGDSYRKILGYLPQKVGYYKNYTAYENLMYVAALKGLREENADSIINMYLDKFGLFEVKDKKVKGFSGGMLQRVGIIGALLNEPEILVLDEPTAGLDPKERVRLKKILSDLGKERIIIVSTHITSDIEFIANKIVMIKDRKILHDDKVDTICSKYNGKIYEVFLDANEVAEFECNNYVLMQQYENNKVKIRFFMDEGADINYRSVIPNLDDVFVCEYKDCTGSEGVLE